MAYFLKKCVKKGRVYLSIVNGYHDPKRGHAVQVTYKSFGTGSGLLEQGITDPVAYCEELVKKLNFEDNRKKCEEVTDRAPIKFGGHFLVNAVLNKLGVKDFIDILSLTTNYQFSLYDVFCALLFSRKSRTVKIFGPNGSGNLSVTENCCTVILMMNGYCHRSNGLLMNQTVNWV